MIRGLLLDYGGVIKPFERPDRPRYQEIALILGINATILTHEPVTAELWRKYVSMKIDSGTLAAEIALHAGVSLSTDQVDALGSLCQHQSYPDMISFLDYIRNQGIETGVISNISPFLAACSRARGDYDIVDFTVLSAEQGYRKPDPRLYHLAHSLFEVRYSPDEILYVDDTPRHLIPAREIGFHTLHITTDMYPIAPHIEHYMHKN